MILSFLYGKVSWKSNKQFSLCGSFSSLVKIHTIPNSEYLSMQCSLLSSWTRVKLFSARRSIISFFFYFRHLKNLWTPKNMFIYIHRRCYRLNFGFADRLRPAHGLSTVKLPKRKWKKWRSYCVQAKSLPVLKIQKTALRNIRKRTWLGRLLLFPSIFSLSIFQQYNPTKTMHSTSTQKNATSRAPTVPSESSLHFREKSKHLYRQTLSHFSINRTHAGSQRWRQSFARQFNAKRMIVWVFLESHLDWILQWLLFPSRW